MRSLPYLLLFVILLPAVNCKTNSKDSAGAPVVGADADTLDTSGDTVADSPESGWTDPDHNSRTSLDWSGTYRGNLPCSDCDGIQTSITLFENGDFTRDRTYQGKPSGMVSDNGTFSWDDGGGVITLHPVDGETDKYRVGENVLFQLDSQGDRYTGLESARHELQKIFNDGRVEDRKWELVELNGTEMTFSGAERKPGFTLHSTLGQVTGNNGCNVFVATYDLGAGNRVSFGTIAQSLKACQNREIADRLGEALQKADNYSVKEGILSLNRARMAPLARFRAAE